MKVDALKNPIHFDKLIDGKWDAANETPPNRYRWQLSIAKLVNNDTLVLCSARANEERPADFTVGSKAPYSLFTYKRQSKEANLPIRIPVTITPATSDQDLIRGTWKVLKTDHNGKVLPGEFGIGDDQVWHIADGKITIRYSDGTVKEMSFRLNQDAKPKAIDVTIKDEGSGQPYPGLYTLDGNSLQIAYSRGAKSRPKDFFADPFIEDRGRRYFLLSRQNPEGKKGEAGAPGDKDLQITKEARKAIDTGLAFLVKEQADDGSFGSAQFNGNVGITSLAGMALLSNVERLGEGARGQAAARAVRYVLWQEDPNVAGSFNQKNTAHGPMYNHGFAVLFLADAHERTGDKKLKADIKAALERAVKVIVKAQNNEGGWRYQPRPVDADLSVSAGQIAALAAARQLGIDIPKVTRDNAAAYIKRCQGQDGGFRYQPFGGPSSFARTGAGLVALNRLGFFKSAEIDKGLDYLRKFDLKNADAAMKLYYSYGHYYVAKAMWYAGEKEWQRWYPLARDDLLRSVRADGTWAEMNCPHYGTSMALIVLQMPHGRLPSLKR
ncbi:MAG: TIGR03067 domain-containing protein [Planctomycetes bacterium]|nr:TIGR03067 domain-containing protein [Planctomycetota bacterium]